ncbi:hypothetical protein BpHYR1_000261 [Brachionus plicatilis]|uniref:Uncharacterized protein n=1 Tax=Brachionus plicatilis TaxID=10195 RepID=A0A3M7PHR7_BRAPC|nr:hypothetical protein BpHYR1_000261 [Brachionus plicatilis]
MDEAFLYLRTGQPSQDKAQKHQIKEMAKEIADSKANPVTNNAAPALSWASIISNSKKPESTMVMIAYVRKELSKTERIQNRLVISGAGYPESEDTDKERVNEVPEVLNLGTNNIIDEGSEKPDEFEQVYVNPDKTQYERVLERN